MSNVVTMKKIPGTEEYETPISFDEEMKLEGGGLNVIAHHPRFGRLWYTITPSTSRPGEFSIREWTICHSFTNRDENGEPLWHLPELRKQEGAA
jgi:hypothetical protein